MQYECEWGYGLVLMSDIGGMLVSMNHVTHEGVTL